MDASLYLEILKVGLLPFLRRVYPNGHCFMQDNNPKHTSAAAREFFAENSINWWKTPPESPDANPIENLWHELKVRVVLESRSQAHDPERECQARLLKGRGRSLGTSQHLVPRSSFTHKSLGTRPLMYYCASYVYSHRRK